MRSDAREWAVLTLTARRALTNGQSAILREYLTAPLNWDRLLAAASDHGTLALLHEHVSAALKDAPDGLARAPVDTLATRRREIAHRNLRLSLELRRALAACRDAGIDALTYKGPVLSGTLFGDVSLRMFSDIDILVREEDHEHARSVLHAIGYTPEHIRSPAQHRSLRHTGHEEAFTADGVKIELQWQTSDAFYGRSLSLGDVWQRRATEMLMGIEVATFGAEDLLVVLAIHGSAHAWDRLIWIADIAELLRRAEGAPSQQLDFDKVMSLARTLRATRRVRLALALASDVLGAPLPSGVARLVASDSVARAVAEEWRLAGPRRDGRGRSLRFHARMTDGLLERVAFLRRALLTPAPADWAFIALPDALSPLYPIVRPMRLLRNALRRV